MMRCREGAPPSISSRSVQEGAEAAAPAGMPQFPQSFCFDLPDALARDSEVLTDFFQGVLGPVFEAETHLDDALFARRESIENLLGHFLQVDVDHGISRRYDTAIQIGRASC